MASSSAVQFFGFDSVIAAYTARGIETWGLFQSKQFINAGDDLASLQTFLKMLEPGGSQAIYTLKVYRDIEDIDALTDKDECNGSFNFKLFNPMAPASLNAGAAIPAQQYSADPVMNKIHGLVTQQVSEVLEKRFSKKEEESDEESEGETLGAIAMQYLKEPDKLIAVINAVRGLFAPADPNFQPATLQPALAGPAQPVRSVGAISAPAQERKPSKDISAEEKLNRLAAALDRLERVDPDFLEHLEALADLAEKKPKQYAMAITFL